MRTIFFILQKEFIQIFRNKTMLPLIFILPVVQLIILVNAATLEMKAIKMQVVDHDLSSVSRKLIAKFEGSPFYKVKSAGFSTDKAEESLLDNSADVVLVIPPHFERDMVRNNGAKVQFLINAINGTAAGLINSYCINILRQFNNDIIGEWYDMNYLKLELPVNITSSFWYNPTLKYTIYMLPGVLVILVTIIGMFLTAINIVREKEIGTIEQINVTPIRKQHFIIGKLIPFLIIALFELAFGLLIGRLFFNQPIEGSLTTLFSLAFVYLLVGLGLGLLLSSVSQTQQQVMFMVYFFMLTFILMSGIFTSTENMPYWAQKINIINPFTYFMRGLRMILLKGSGLADISKEFISLAVYAIIAISMAVWRYRKVA